MKLNIKEICVFGMLGSLIYALKALMALLPNIHLVGVFIVAITVVYRKKALWPIYVYVFIEGLIGGFASWWLPYLYIWAVLWLWTMLLPRELPQKARPFIYMGVCALHGFLFGLLYSPGQALIFGLDLKGTITWIIAGIPADLIHGVSNFICGTLIVPIIRVLNSTKKYISGN